MSDDAGEYFMEGTTAEPAPTPQASGSRHRATIPDLALEAGLPASIDSEKTILGAVLLDNAAHAEAAEVLGPDDFSLDSHRRIFLRMSELMDAHRSVDIVTLANELARWKEVEAVGGVAYLASLTEGLPRRPVIGEYIRIVRDKAMLRRIMGLASAAIAQAADQSEDAIGVGMRLGAGIDKVVAAGVTQTYESAGAFLRRQFGSSEKMIEHIQKLQGITTSFGEFDQLTCGLQKGDLIVVGARPSIGKSAFMLKIAEHVGIDCESHVGIYSLEMKKEQLMRRMVSSRARVPWRTVFAGKLDSHQAAEISDAYAEIDRAPIYVDDSSGRMATDIVRGARSMKRNVDLDLLLIDYLGLFLHPDSRRSAAQEVGLDCAMIKNLAMELEIPVILLCQLNRELTKRTDKRPMLSDLRDSGSIEQDADLVAFLHREHYYDKTNESLRGKGEIILAKQRNGPTQTCHVAYDDALMRWSDPPDPNAGQTDFKYF